MQFIPGLNELLMQLSADSPNEFSVIQISQAKVLAFEEAEFLFYKLVERVKPAILNHPIRLAVSLGKDSLLMLAVFVEAHRQLLGSGKSPAAPLIITRADTGIESPVMTMFARRQLRLLSTYLNKHHIPFEIFEAKPADRYAWSTMYLSGLKLITVGASKYADCSVILKSDPLNKVESKLAKKYPNGIVTATGVRMAESFERAQNIKRFGLDTAQVTETDADGRRSLDYAPIVDIQTDEVWMMIRALGDSAKRTYGKCLPYWDKSTWYLRKLYDDQTDNCPITASGVFAGGSSGGCSSSLRSGCALCTVVNIDKQAETLADLPQYPQLRNLLAIRNWMSHHFFNNKYRRYIGRKPNTDGYVKIQPNTFNEEWMQSMLRWCLQADRDEQLRAMEFSAALKSDAWLSDSGIKSILSDDTLENWQKEEWITFYIEDMQEPTFQIVTPEQLLLIEAFWSRDSYQISPYTAIKIWHEVYHELVSVRYPIVTGPRYQNNLPAPRYIFVGQDPEFQDIVDINKSTVFARYLSELNSFDFSNDNCSYQQLPLFKTTQPITYGKENGAVFEGWFGDWYESPIVECTNENDDSGYVIDSESAHLILMDFIDDYVKRYWTFHSEPSGLSYKSNISLRSLMAQGVLRLSHQAKINTARLIARSTLYERAGLVFLSNDRDEIERISISEEDLLRITTIQTTSAEELLQNNERTVDDELRDLGRSLFEIRYLYRELIYSRNLALLTLNQKGQNFVFDGRPYRSLVSTQNRQINQIQALLKSPAKLKCLLPANALLRLNEMSVEVEKTLIRVCESVIHEFGVIQKQSWLDILNSLNSEDVNNDSILFVRNRMGFVTSIDAAKKYVNRHLLSLTLSDNSQSIAAA